MGKRSISAAELKAECTVLERAVRSAGLATPESLAGDRPGGERNPATDAYGWLGYYRTLHRLHARQTFRETSGDAGDVEAVIAALAEHAEAVVFPVGSEHRQVMVHPKSFVALQAITTIDARIQWLLVQRKHFFDGGAWADAPQTAQRIDEEIAYQYGLVIWAATHEGPGLPFSPLVLPDDVPPWIGELDPWQIRLIHLAFVKVNAMRLQAVQQLLNEVTKEGDPAQRPSWATFFASTATEQNTTAPALMRDRSLAGVLSTALIASESRLAATRRAEAKAKEEVAHG